MQFYLVPYYLAATLGLRGDLDEARLVLAEGIRLGPDFSTLTAWRRYPVHSYAPFAELQEKTFFRGLNLAGMSEE